MYRYMDSMHVCMCVLFIVLYTNMSLSLSIHIILYIRIYWGVCHLGKSLQFHDILMHVICM